MTLPPFERLYLAHRDDVHASLRRLARPRPRRRRVPGDVPARAPRLRPAAHADNLRAWLLTIARNVALDELRRTRPLDGAGAPGAGRAAARSAAGYEQLADLAGAAPGEGAGRRRAPLRLRPRLRHDRRRARLVRRGRAPGRLLRSPPPAKGAHMISDALDARLRARAAAEGLLDAAFDVVDSPIGAAPPRGDAARALPHRLPRRPGGGARGARPRLRAARPPLDRAAARREAGARRLLRGQAPRRSTCRSTCAATGFAGARARGARARPLRRGRHLRRARAPRREPEGRARGRDDDEPEPDPDRPPVPPRRRREREPRRLRRRPRHEALPARARGRPASVDRAGSRTPTR